MGLFCRCSAKRKKGNFFGDAAWTFPIGPVDEKAQKLLQIGQEALKAGIAAFKFRDHLQEIGKAIQTKVEENGFSVVREFVGHGVGYKLHEFPQVRNYVPTEEEKKENKALKTIKLNYNRAYIV